MGSCDRSLIKSRNYINTIHFCYISRNVWLKSACVHGGYWSFSCWCIKMKHVTHKLFTLFGHRKASQKLQLYMLIFHTCDLGSVLPAHRAVLVARCDVMAAMFSGKYAEARSRVVPIHGVSSDTFLSFLEYLYTDSCCPGEFPSLSQQQWYDHCLAARSRMND